MAVLNHLYKGRMSLLLVALLIAQFCQGSDFSGVVCQPESVSVAQSRCDNGNFQMVVSYNFSRSCNASLQGSLTLPLPKRRPCSCPPGEGVQPNASECAPCLPGQYGVGGRIIDDWEKWYSKDVPGLALEMTTYCETPSLQADLKCNPWQPDASNSFLFIHTDPSVVSVFVLEMTMRVTSAPGKVRFSYYVDAGQCFHDDMAESLSCNGLTFYIDSKMVMAVNSQQLTWLEKEFEISKTGYYQLRWVFRQMNVKSTQSREQMYNEARIQRIVLEGVPGNAACHPCARGSYTSSQNQTICQKCPAYSFQNETGQDSCRPCLNGKYSLQGSAYCFDLPPCTPFDLLNHLDTIDKCYPDNAKEPFQWVRHEWAEWQHHYGYNRPFCEPQAQSSALLNHTVLCRCQPGQQFIALQKAHTTPLCIPCPTGTASPDGLTCIPCDPGYITHSTRFYKSWAKLPDAFSTKCTGGKCGSLGWIPSGDHIRTGYSVGTYDKTLTWKEFTIEKEGALSFYCSINCTFRSEIRLPQTKLPQPSASNISSRSRSAKKGLAPTNECHLGMLILNDTGSVRFTSCSKPAARDGTLFHHQYTLPRGNYSVIWSYHQVDPYERESVGFEGRLYNISVTGTTDLGGAYQCKACPAGYYAINYTHCLPCQPGTYSKYPGSSKCTKCLDGFFADQAGSKECLKCGDGTTSDLTHTGCNANCMRTQQMRFKSTYSRTSEMRNFTFNFSPLGNPSRPMFNATKPEISGKQFYVNLCTTSHDKSSCTSGDKTSMTPIPTMACMEDCSHVGKTCKSHSFGKTMGFQISDNGQITLEVTNGDPCSSDVSKHRKALVHLKCNHTTGLGNPVIRLLSNDGCLLEYDWETQYACPICTEQCYEVQETGCGNNGHRTVSRVQVQPCWGGTVDPPSSQVEKCYLTYVIVGSIVVVVFILLVVFFILRMHHERVKSSREIFDDQLKKHLYRLSLENTNNDMFELDSDDDQT